MVVNVLWNASVLGINIHVIKQKHACLIVSKIKFRLRVVVSQKHCYYFINSFCFIQFRKELVISRFLIFRICRILICIYSYFRPKSFYRHKFIVRYNYCYYELWSIFFLAFLTMIFQIQTGQVASKCWPQWVAWSSSISSSSRRLSSPTSLLNKIKMSIKQCKTIWYYIS